MKNLLRLLLMLFLYPYISNAGIFGASNYDECVNDGKVGRTNLEMKALMTMCQKKFPKFPKLYNKKDARLECINDETMLYLHIMENKLKIDNGSFYQLNVRTNEKITFVSDKIVKYKDKYMNATIVIDTLDGTANFNVKNANINDTIFYTCTEQ